MPYSVWSPWGSVTVEQDPQGVVADWEVKIMPLQATSTIYYLPSPVTTQGILDAIDVYTTAFGTIPSHAYLSLQGMTEFIVHLQTIRANPAPPQTIQDEILPDIEPLPEYVLPSCECGAKSVGYEDYMPGHSSWCPVRE
jgi:hypothetical protein